MKVRPDAYASSTARRVFSGWNRRPIAHAKRSVAEEDYKEGLALAQLAPGLLAAQLAIYLGYVLLHSRRDAGGHRLRRAFLPDGGGARLGLCVLYLQLAVIVRGADTSRLDLTPQSAGLYASSLGLSRIYAGDQEMLRHGMVMYDALYA